MEYAYGIQRRSAKSSLSTFYSTYLPPLQTPLRSKLSTTIQKLSLSLLPLNSLTVSSLLNFTSFAWSGCLRFGEIHKERIEKQILWFLLFILYTNIEQFLIFLCWFISWFML